MSPEKRVLAQWNAAYGCPLSDEAKAQFRIHAVGLTFKLADVRLWTNHYQQKKADENGTIFLEFFFDGSPEELGDQEDEFKRAFETMIEQQLQEVRLKEFRKRLTARRRGRGSHNSGRSEDGVEGGGGEIGSDDGEWREYLQKPVPATELSIRSLREAGCMLRFLVCQTSLSVSASEVLGQIAFQEHFPIDGVAQEPSKSTMPMPKWVYGLAVCTVGVTVITICAWWQIVKVALIADPSSPVALPE